MSKNSVNAKIEFYRKSNNISKIDFANKLDITIDVLDDIEQGLIDLRFEDIVTIAAKLKVSLNYFLCN